MKPRLRQRGARWDASIEIWQNGQRKTLSAGTHPSEDAAEAAGWALALKYADSPQERQRAYSTMNLAQWAERWLILLNDQVKANTKSIYAWRLNKWVLPELGTIRLVDITKGRINGWLAEMNLSHRSKKAALSTLSVCLDAAKAQEKISANPCDEVELKQSKAKKAAQKCKIWTPEQAEALLAVEDTTARLIMHLGLYGGLRRGEILGLEWSDVDWLKSELHIQRNVVSTPDGVLYDETPKNGEDRRIKLAPAALSALALAKEQAGEADTRLFSLSPRQIQTRFEKARKLAGVPEMSMHHLRHTCASILLSSGISVVAVANHLGHSDPVITLRYYGHLMPEDANQCASALEAALAPPAVKLAA